MIIPNDPNIKSLDLSGLIGRWYATGSLLSSIPDVDICPGSSTDVNSDEIDDEETRVITGKGHTATDDETEPMVNDSEDDEDPQDADGGMEDEESVVVYGFPSESSKLAQTLKDSGSCIFSTGNASFQPNSLHGEDCKCKVFPWGSVDEIKEYIKIYNVAKALWYQDPESQKYNDTINPWKPHERTIQNQIMDSTTTKDLYEPVMPKGLFPCNKLMKDYSRPTMERLWNNCFPPFLNEETKELPEFVNHSCVPGVRELSKLIKKEDGMGEFDLQELCSSSSNNGGESGVGISLHKPKGEKIDDLNEWWEKIRMDQFDFRKYKTQILDPMIELHEEKHAMKMEELDKKLFKKFHMEHKAIFDSINPGQHLKILTEVKKWYLFNISQEVNIKINGSSGEICQAKFLWVDIMPIIKNFVVPHTLMSYEKNKSITLAAFPIKKLERSCIQSEDDSSKMTVRCTIEFFRRTYECHSPSNQLEYVYQQDIEQPIKTKSNKKTIKITKSAEEKIAEKEKREQEKLMKEFNRAEKQKERLELQMEIAQERWIKAQQELFKSQIKRKIQDVEDSCNDDDDDNEDSEPTEKKQKKKD